MMSDDEATVLAETIVAAVLAECGSDGTFVGCNPNVATEVERLIAESRSADAELLAAATRFAFGAHHARAYADDPDDAWIVDEEPSCRPRADAIALARKLHAEDLAKAKL